MSQADHEDISTGSSRPAEHRHLFGHQEAQHAFLSAVAGNRLPHAWLISGPSGVGKATLAYAMARLMLSGSLSTVVNEAAQALDTTSGLARISLDEAIAARIAVGSHGDLLVVDRGFDEKRQRERTEIPVDQIRRIIPFMQSTAAEGGWRVVIVDGADTMNRSAQNALLKGLEEPPNHTLLLLLADRPERLLPTVKSRCRQLVLSPLSDQEMTTALSELLGASASDLSSILPLSGGCPGEAMRIVQADIHGLWASLQLILERDGQASNVNARELPALATSIANDPTRWQYFGRLLRHWLHDRAKALAIDATPGIGPLDQPFAMWDKISRHLAEADQRNLDRRLVALQILEQLRRAA
ncbi:MAG: DNA polymerase III subunit delta' [Pseudomonadota bacterium]